MGSRHFDTEILKENLLGSVILEKEKVMINCRICNKEIAESAPTCPGCGVERPDIKQYKMHNNIWGSIFLTGGVVSLLSKVWSHKLDGWILLSLLFIGSGIFSLYYGITGKDFDGNKAPENTSSASN